MARDFCNMEKIDSNVLVDKLLFGVNQKYIDRFLISYGDAKLGQGAPTSSLLRDIKLECRFLGLVKYLITHCKGAKISETFELGQALLNWLQIISNFSSLKLDNKTEYVASTFLTFARASHELFEYEVLKLVHDKLITNLVNIMDSAQYWKGVSLLAVIELRRFDIEAAQERWHKIPAKFHDEDEIAQLKQELEKYSSGRFELASTIQKPEKIMEIWQESIPAMIASFEHYRTQLQEVEVPQFPLIENLLEQMSEIALNPDISIEKSMEKIAKARAEFRKLWKEVLGIAPTSYWTLSRIDDLTEDTEALHYQTNTQILVKHLNAVDQAILWCEEKNNWSGWFMLHWHSVLISVKLVELSAAPIKKHLKNAIRIIDKTLDIFIEFGVNVPNKEAFTSVTNQYSGLVSVCFDESGQPIDPLLAFKAIELVKYRALLAQKVPFEHYRVDDEFEPNILGESTHYLAFSNHNLNNKIYSSIYLSSGQIDGIELDISSWRVRQELNRLNPKEWIKKTSFFDHHEHAYDTLSPLLFMLNKYIKLGNIKQGDHICISAEDPVFPIPINYLVINGKLAIEWFSISHVASFSEAVTLYRSSKPMPNTAEGIYVASQEEKHLTDKIKQFKKHGDLIESTGMTSNFEDMSVSTRAEITAKFEHEKIVHLDTHGQFENNGDPMKQAGLLTPINNVCPTRNGDIKYLLTPQILLDSAPSLLHSHITLNACVSGLASPGKGGDHMGLEFSFRILGASSVIASQWNVDYELSNELLLNFYIYWLKDRQSKAGALREATLKMIAKYGADRIKEKCLYCFFSLYGDWR